MPDTISKCLHTYFECDTARKEICVIGLSSMSAIVKMRAMPVKMTREMHETTACIMCAPLKQSVCRGSGAQQQNEQSVRPA